MSTPIDTNEEIPDFSKPRKRVAFKIDNDIFEAPPAIPAMVLMDYAKKFNSSQADDLSADEQLAVMTDLLSVILKPTSHARFIARMSDVNEPIELDQIQQSIEYLMGRYGMRPTQPASNSSTGPVDQEPGMSSTGNTPVVVSTSQEFV